ncbi:hypothetical protein SAMN05444004_10634 [Jannaschia faecimaris]|uniref:Uncharacterized protein n=1 Tax=Jannaschia faecimaris TaxID=1244108 RepID=A0A1H3QBA2_9RHOB|nr:hypothetical protein [Jannaschia faecimaris]SDZ09969.1 hypothetical protein SAMN05444004_10634 [Jannaschia faecimaris]
MNFARLFVMALSLALLGGASWASFTSYGLSMSRDVGAAAVARGASVRSGSIGGGGLGRLRVK